MHRSIPVLVVLASMILVGCSSTRYTLSGSWPYIEDQGEMDEDAIPERIVAIWSHDVIKTRGENPTQGFTGRLFFYDKKNRPTEVDGRLAVFAFDDSDSATPGWSPKKKADRKFVFTEEQLPGHLGISKVGASYSIWIPWQELGESQKTVSLIPILTGGEGLRVVGPPTKNVLPGKSSRNEQGRVTADPNGPPVVFPNADDLRQLMREARNRQSGGVQAAGFETHALSGAIGRGENRAVPGESGFARPTMTLDMSRNMTRAYVNNRSAEKPVSSSATVPLDNVMERSAAMPAIPGLAGDQAADRVVSPTLPVLPTPAARTPEARSHWQPTLRPSSIQSYGEDGEWGAYRRR
ncbi:MAG: hypothetical protein VYB09_05465 [Planctomycetota bacterium]|nr:hypothetical protein [Planctomycetota bacterium]